jgi:hypothetical protein
MGLRETVRNTVTVRTRGGVISTFNGVAFRVIKSSTFEISRPRTLYTFADFLQIALLSGKIRLPSKIEVCFPGSTGHEHHMPYLL